MRPADARVPLSSVCLFLIVVSVAVQPGRVVRWHGEQRLREHRKPAPTVLAYPDAGHAVFGLPMALDDPRLTVQGGTPKGAAAARA